MIDLLLITAPFTYTFGPAQGPALLKACATRSGINARSWDLSAEFNFSFGDHEFYQNIIAWMCSPELKLSQQEFDWYQSIVKHYAKRITEYQPRNLGISLLTQNSQRFTEDICYHVRLLDPSIKIILGGPGNDIFQYQYQLKWYDLLLKEGLADTVILGEGEYALAQVIQQDYYGVLNVPQLTNKELDNIPIPDYNDYDFSWYQNNTHSYWEPKGESKGGNDLLFLITSSKGCVKNCSFCDVGKIWSKFRFRSAQSVADEIIFLHKKYNAKYFSFTDSLMNGGLKVFYDLNCLLEEQLPNTVKYEGQIICRSQSEMPERYFKAMANAGCEHVSIGMESGSEQVRMHMGKGSRQADIHYTTEMLTKYNIKQSWNIIAGYPTETNDDWVQTMDLIRQWLPRSQGLLTVMPISTFLLLDNTPMTTTDQYRNLHIEKSIISGYSSFGWSTGINPGNTFDVRAARFFELCNYLLDYNREVYSFVIPAMETTQRQLEFYLNDTKQKKIFSLSPTQGTPTS